MSERRPYAYLCPKCDHLSADHRMVPDGTLVEGPYRCRQPGCECERPQDASDIGLSRQQFDLLPACVRAGPSS